MISNFLESEGPYDVIYADPPWTYKNAKTGGSMSSGAAQQYDVMTLEDICAMPIKSLSAKDAVLFMWVTTPLKDYGFEVMKAWGFKYKTTVYWRKTMSLGMGFWFRGQVEELLFGVRGKVKAFRLQEANIIQAKVIKHSAKPEEFRQLIERATANMPSQRRIELFARQQTPGWDAWGNEIEGETKDGN